MMAHNTDTRMISCRVFTLTVHSARNLPDVRHVFRNRIQVQIKLGDDAKSKIKSPADIRHGLRPVWNFHARYVLPVSKIMVENLPVRIRLYSSSKLGDRYVGEVNFLLRNLFNRAEISGSDAGEAAASKSADPADFPLIGKASETGGQLNMSYSFGEPFLMEEDELRTKSQNTQGGGPAVMELVNKMGAAIKNVLEIVKYGLGLADDVKCLLDAVDGLLYVSA